MKTGQLDDMQIVWVKWIRDVEGKDYGKTFWTLRDISKYEFIEFDLCYFGHKQYLQYNWNNDSGHGTVEIDLKSYPRLTSKKHLILLCNIERPYVPKDGDVIIGAGNERHVVRL